MAHATRNKHPIWILVLVDLVLSGILFACLYFLHLPRFLLCTSPFAENLITAVGIAFIVQLVAFKTYKNFWIAAIDIGLILIALWLGSYSMSPLGFSSGRIPVAQGFILTRSMRPDAQIVSGETINVVSGSAIALQAITLPVNTKCVWVSTKGGSLDDPGNCAIVYMPPAASDFDLLKVLIQPACHLPEVQENIRIVVLP